jgi:hypothetical protein
LDPVAPDLPRRFAWEDQSFRWKRATEGNLTFGYSPTLKLFCNRYDSFLTTRSVDVTKIFCLRCGYHNNTYRAVKSGTVIRKIKIVLQRLGLYLKPAEKLVQKSSQQMQKMDAGGLTNSAAIIQ